VLRTSRTARAGEPGFRVSINVTAASADLIFVVAKFGSLWAIYALSEPYFV
jgi:hypothetical protein